MSDSIRASSDQTRASETPQSNHGGAPERRRRRRALISAPIRVRAVEVTKGGPDEVATTIDVSRIGVLFISAQSGYIRGMEVKVTFPYSSSPAALNSEQDGRVARVVEMSDGRHGVGVMLGTAGVGKDLVDAAGRKLSDSSVGPEGQPGNQARPLVVLVDEDAAVRELTKTYLVNEGYRVIAVNNASDGREVLNLFTPALLIAEIQGEDLPGYALCAHVKSTPRLQKVPIVLTTSSGNPSDYSGAHSLGAVVCMTKPYRQQRIGQVVRLLVPRSQGGTATRAGHSES